MKYLFKIVIGVIGVALSFYFGVAFQSRNSLCPRSGDEVVENFDEKGVGESEGIINGNLIRYDFPGDALAFLDFDSNRRELIIVYSRAFDSKDGRSESAIKVCFDEVDGVQIMVSNFAKRGSEFFDHLNRGLGDDIQSRIDAHSDLGNNVEYIDLDGDGLVDFRKQLGAVFALEKTEWKEVSADEINNIPRDVNHRIIVK